MAYTSYVIELPLKELPWDAPVDIVLQLQRDGVCGAIFMSPDEARNLRSQLDAAIVWLNKLPKPGEPRHEVNDPA